MGDTQNNTSHETKPYRRWNDYSAKIHKLWLFAVTGIVICAIIGAVLIVWLPGRNNSNSASDQKSAVSDTEISATEAIKSDAQQSKKLLSNPPTEKATATETLKYYTDLLGTLHDSATIISTYETAQSKGLQLSPGLAATVAEAYHERNLAGDNDKARAALDAARSYIKSQPYTTGDGGTDEMLADVDVTQKDLGL